MTEITIIIAVSSGIAAIFAAAAAFLSWKTQRQAFLHSVRPELVLEDWTRDGKALGDSESETTVSFGMIKNIGRGVALHASVSCFESSVEGGSERPLAVLSNFRIPVMAADASAPVPGHIHVFWRNVRPREDCDKFLPIHIHTSL